MLCRKTGCCKGQLTAADPWVSLLISKCNILPLSVDAYLTSVYIFLFNLWKINWKYYMWCCQSCKTDPSFKSCVVFDFSAPKPSTSALNSDLDVGAFRNVIHGINRKKRNYWQWLQIVSVFIVIKVVYQVPGLNPVLLYYVGTDKSVFGWSENFRTLKRAYIATFWRFIHTKVCNNVLISFKKLPKSYRQ